MPDFTGASTYTVRRPTFVLFATKFDVETHAGRGVVLEGQASTFPKGRCPGAPKYIGTCIRPQGLIHTAYITHSNHILHGDHTVDDRKFLQVDHAPPWSKIPTRDLFAIANLFVRIAIQS